MSGPGQYPDLRPKTKAEKTRLGFSVYPILKRTGRLAESLTNPAHTDAINEIVNKTVLFIGSRVEYLVFHQSDASRTIIPLRKVLFIGPEAPRFATGEQIGRLQRWVSILEEYEISLAEAEGFKSG